MSRGGDRSRQANPVVNAVEQVCGLYRVPSFRTQSRTFMVPGRHGEGERPISVGKWRDDYGVEHTGGMADILATPLVLIARLLDPDQLLDSAAFLKNKVTTVPLWIECKAGSGKLRPEQIAFRDYVLRGGAHHLECHDSADALLAWFSKMGVKR